MISYKSFLLNLTRPKIIFLRRIAIAFLFVLIILIAIVCLSWLSFSRVQKSEVWVGHTYIVITDYQSLMVDLAKAELAERGYLITPDTTFLRGFKRRTDSTFNDYKILYSHITDNASQVKRLDSLNKCLGKHFLMMGELISMRSYVDSKSVDVDAMKADRALMSQTRGLILRGEREEKTLLTMRINEQLKATYYSKIAIFILSIIAFIIIIVAIGTVTNEFLKRMSLEGLLKSVLDASPSGILSFSSVRNDKGKIIDFHIIQANSNAYQLTGSVSKKFIGEKMLTVFPTMTTDLLEKYINVVETGASYNTDIRFKSKGKVAWFHLETIKLGDGFTSTFTDITNEKISEQELENSIVALKRSNRELEEFAYVASHDLQEPLRKILIFIDRLSSKLTGAITEDAKTYFDHITQSANRMRVLINHLLAYSRIDKEKMENIKVDLNVVIKSVLLDLNLVIQEKNASVNVSPLPVIEGIDILMHQLFQNLLSNSLKFSKPEQAPVITIKCDYLDSSQNDIIPYSMISKDCWCRISITDNGIGFDNQYANKIFLLFQRLHGQSEYAGTGLGLAICKKIVLAHHGTIIAQGNKGDGAVFVITLPLSQSNKS